MNHLVSFLRYVLPAPPHPPPASTRHSVRTRSQLETGFVCSMWLFGQIRGNEQAVEFSFTRMSGSFGVLSSLFDMATAPDHATLVAGRVAPAAAE
jgi:hypothetical protein